jgi:uncharacterized membrane protein YjjP (DUF1212 family)
MSQRKELTMENKDYIVFSLLLLGGTSYLFYSAEAVRQYPFFMAVTFSVVVSIAAFFIFLPKLRREWFYPLIIVNGGLSAALPIVQGMSWIWFSLLYLILLSFLMIGYSLYKKK